MAAFQCSKCGKHLSVNDNLASKQARCPGCGGVTTLPAARVATMCEEEPVAPRRTKKSPKTLTPGDRGDAPTRARSGAGESTQGFGPLAVKHDPSFTDFLSPPQADDELGRLG